MRGGLESTPVGSGRGASGFVKPTARRVGQVPTRPDLVLLLIAAVIFTYAWRLHAVVAAAGILRPTLLLGLAVVAVAFRVPMSLVGRRLRSSVVALLALLILLAAVGLPFALDTTEGTRYLMTWILPGVLLTALVAIAVRSVDDVEWVILATLAGAAIYLAILYSRGGVNAVTDPSVTVFYDRNELALMLVALLPATLHFLRPGERATRRAFAAVCFLLFVFTIVRGGSRGGLVGLAVVMSYVLLTFRSLPRSARLWTAVATFLLLAAGGSAYWARMRTIIQPEADYNWSGRTYGRASLWRRGLQYIRERPLVGVGVHGFPVAEGQLSSPARQRMRAGRPLETLNAHNIFIQVAGELGLPGLALFVALLVQMARTLRRLRHRYDAQPRATGVAHVLLAALLGYVVCGLFLSAAYFPLLYLLIGLVVAVAAVARPEPATQRRRVRGGSFAAPTPARTPPAYELPAPARW